MKRELPCHVYIDEHDDGHVVISRDDSAVKLLVILSIIAAASVGALVLLSLPGWLAIVAIAGTVVAALGFSVHGIATASDREVRNVITTVNRLVVNRNSSGYRGPPRETTLAAAGRRWPLATLRALEIGVHPQGHRTLYLVMPDEVLAFVSLEDDGEALAHVAEAIGTIVDKTPQEKEDKDYQHATWAPALLVFPPLLFIAIGAYLSLDRPLFAIATVLVPLAWTHFIQWRTRRILLPVAARYARERFGIEPYAG